MTTVHGLVPLDARRLLAALGLGMIALALVLAPRAAQPPPAQHAAGSAKLPLSFVPNRGQADAPVRYYAQTPGFSAWFTPRGVTMALSKGKRGHAVELRFVGADPHATIEGERQLAGTFSEFSGRQRHVGLPTYGEVVYRDLWPGIDVVFERGHGRLKYELHVAPGARLSDVEFAYRGADAASIASHGAIRVRTPAGTIADAAPVSYQRSRGTRVPVATRYSQIPGTAHFKIEAPAGYDHRRPLVVDPSVVWATFVGGAGHDHGEAIAVDAAGSAYIAGFTGSPDFPTTPGAFDSRTSFKAFVAKLTPDGSDLVYSTAVGAVNGVTVPSGIAVDDAGHAFIAGTTTGTGYPTTPGAFDPDGTSFDDAFVTKLNATGTGLDYSTYLGPLNNGRTTAIGIDRNGAAYVTGITLTPQFPTTPGGYDTSFSGLSTFVSKLNAAGSALDYSTFLGNSAENSHDLAVDPAGSAYVVLSSDTGAFPVTAGAFDTSYNGSYDAVLTKLNPEGSGLVYSTYIGSSGFDTARKVKADAAGQAYVVGQTGSANFPVTPGAYDTSQNGGLDVWAAKLNASGSALAYATYIGGPGFDEHPDDLDIDSRGNAYVVGRAVLGFPTVPQEANPPSPVAGFTLKLAASGAKLAYSTLKTSGDAVAAGPNGTTYLTGTTGPEFQPTPGAYDTTYNDVGTPSDDAFVTKLGPGLPATLTLSPSAAVNTLDETAHCVTAALTDAGGDETPGIDVTFTVTGAVTASGAATSDAAGKATFCYQAPAFPGTDHIFATVQGGTSGTATKTWVLPASTDDCRVSGGGRIRAANDDVATFENHVRVRSGAARGRIAYTDRGPAQPLSVESRTIDSLVCDGRRATIYGTAAGTAFRVEVEDRGQPGRRDTYRVVTVQGYDSGTQPLAGGNIKVR